MKEIIFIFFLLPISFVLNAQELNSCKYEIKGRVLDAKTKEALPYVQVVVKGTEYYSITDDEGKFHIKNLCEEYKTLAISYVGYQDTSYQRSQGEQNFLIYLKEESKYLETVTVTAERKKEEGTVSISQQTLGKEVLSADVTQSLASALSKIEGVTFTSVGNNVQLPVIHGLYGNRILVLNNGFKHGFQNWGRDHAPEIDISTANNVTIVKGAAGVRYGPEALAGAIIVEGNPLRLNKPLRAKVGTGYQSNGRGYFINSELGQGYKNWSYNLGASYTKIGDRQTPDYLLMNTGKDEKSFNAGVRYQLKNVDFKVYYSYINQDLGVLRASYVESGDALTRAFNSARPDDSFIRPFSYNIREPNQVAQHHLGKVEINWWYADDASLTFRYGKQLNQREEYDVRRNEERPIIDLDLVTDDFQLEWKHPKWFDLDGLVGLQVFTQNNDNNPGTFTLNFIPNYNTFRFSAFIIESLEKNKNTFEFGIRLDNESNDVRGREPNSDVFQDEYSFTNLTSSLGYIRQLSDNATFRTNFGIAWRTPNVAELFSFGQHGPNMTFGLLRFYFNEEGEPRTDRVALLNGSDASPERGYKWINEWRSQQKQHTFTWTAYGHYIESFTYDRPVTVSRSVRGPTPAWRVVQADALFLGTDFTWQRDWSKSFNGILGLSYLWSRNVQEDEALINQPPITTSYQLTWEKKKLWKFESSQLSIKPSYTFEQFQAPRTIPIEDLIEGRVMITSKSEIFDYKDAPDGYFLLDMAWRFKIKQFEASLSVQNILNTRYRMYLDQMRYFADGLGRNFLFTINYNLNSN